MSCVPMMANRVGDHVARAISSSADKWAKPALDLQAVGLVGAVGDQVDAELALRRIDCCAGIPGRDGRQPSGAPSRVDMKANMES